MTDVTPQKQGRRPHEEPKELELGETDAGFEYAVHYMDDRNQWFVMSGRNYDEGYRNPPPGGGRYADVTTSASEADDTAQALAKGLAYPHDPRSRLHRRVLAARVITRVSVATVSAVYGDVPRETSEPQA